jgi:anti-sigma regulatory factor (Ser/Thr protein kinase)
MQDFSLHILDLVENSITAGAKQIEIKVVEDGREDLLTIEIKDNGRGMSEEMISKVLDPFVTTRTTRRVGLGLSLFAQAARSCDGEVIVNSELGRGTRLVGTFQLSHIDLKPWGSMVNTLVTLIVGNPEIDFYYHHQKDSFEYSLDTEVIKKELGEVPISNTEVINLLRSDLEENLNQIGID